MRKRQNEANGGKWKRNYQGNEGADLSKNTVYFIVLDPPMYTAVTEFDWFYLRGAQDNEEISLIMDLSKFL